MLTHGVMGRMVLAERICFLIQAPLPHSLQAFSIGYVTVHHCQQARYVHQFVHQFSVGDLTASIPHTDIALIALE